MEGIYRTWKMYEYEGGVGGGCYIWKFVMKFLLFATH
jgi:hypothetical protein